MTPLSLLDILIAENSPATYLVEKLTFEELYPLKEHNSIKEKMENYPKLPWFKYNIYAHLTKDATMNVWNGKHPVEENCTSHICKSGSKVIVWMVSRFGDVGVTDNFIDPHGYDNRGLDPEIDLINWEFILK